MGQHCAIICPNKDKRMALVNAILSDVSKEYLVVKLDVSHASNVRELCIQYIDTVCLSHNIEEKLDSLKENDESVLIQKTFELAEIFANRFHKKAIVFFDEFGDIDGFGTDIIKKMRSIFQTHKNTVYIFSGSQASTMNTIFLDKSNAFFNFASIMKMENI